MPWLLPKPIPEQASRRFDRWIGGLAERLDDPSVDDHVLVREVLAELRYGRPYPELEEHAPWAAFALDPSHVTFEAEHYAATDETRFAKVKPLLWLWRNLDDTPLGLSLSTGIPLRRMIAERVFGRVGRDVKIFPGVEVSVGYNLQVGDDVVIHRHVFLDDIGGIELHDGVSIADYASVYSHTHDIREPSNVTLQRTVLGRGVRVAYHATVLAGTVLSDDSMLGALGLATRDLQPHVVGLGIPARPRVWKERAGDPRFVRLAVNADERPREPEVAGNPDFTKGEE